jgi:hypothetical protein
MRQERGKPLAFDRGDIGIRSDNPVHCESPPCRGNIKDEMLSEKPATVVMAKQARPA